jgi:hypothetical protein
VITAAVAAVAGLLALVALATYVVTVVRTAERERADAMVRAEKMTGERDLAESIADTEIGRLTVDVRRATRRADALEEWARKRTGAVDDGTDLLLAELSIIAAGGFDDETAEGSDPGTGARVLDAQAVDRSAAASAGDIARDDTLPGGTAP